MDKPQIQIMYRGPTIVKINKTPPPTDEKIFEDAVDCDSHLTFESYGGFHQTAGPTECNIINDLQKYNFPDEIIIEANNVYNSWDKPKHRKYKRTLLLYACLYKAYSNLNLTFYPNQLANILGMNINHISQATRFITSYDTTASNVVIKTADDFIKNLSCEINIPYDLRDDLYDMTADLVITGEDYFDDYAPQAVAIIIISYFCEFNGLELDCAELQKKYAISNTSATKLLTIIKKIYNDLSL